MEAICIKLDERIIKNIDLSLKRDNYTTRTDFIREAIRDKLRQLEKDRAIKELKRHLGSLKPNYTSKNHEEVRDEVAKQYAKKFGIDLD